MAITLNAEQMNVYRAERAKGNSVQSSRNVARGDYAHKSAFTLDWDGYEGAEATVGDYEIKVEIKPDYDIDLANHNDGDFDEYQTYRTLPWGRKRSYDHRFIVASVLTQQERNYRQGNHEPSTRSARNWARDSWMPYYVEYGVIGGSKKNNNGVVVHDLMDYYWRHGDAKGVAYEKAMQQMHETAKFIANVEYYGIVVTVTCKGVEVAEDSCWGFDVDTRKPTWESFTYIKEQAQEMAESAVQDAKKKLIELHAVAQKRLLEVHGVAQTTFF